MGRDLDQRDADVLRNQCRRLSMGLSTHRGHDSIRRVHCGSFRVRSTNGLRVTPPISMKFGTLADNTSKKSVQIFSNIGQAVFEIRPSKKWKKGRFFATRPVSQMSITFFLLEVGSLMIALFKALIWL